MPLHFVLNPLLLSLVALNKPEWMGVIHDTALRGMFYVVILALWILWVDGINGRTSGQADRRTSGRADKRTGERKK